LQSLQSVCGKRWGGSGELAMKFSGRGVQACVCTRLWTPLDHLDKSRWEDDVLGRADGASNGVLLGSANREVEQRFSPAQIFADIRWILDSIATKERIGVIASYISMSLRFGNNSLQAFSRVASTQVSQSHKTILFFNRRLFSQQRKRCPSPTVRIDIGSSEPCVRSRTRVPDPVVKKTNSRSSIPINQ